MSTTVTLRTCDLIGAALDWAVAKACNAFVAFDFYGRLMDMSDLAQFGARPTYSPSTDWSQGGPLLYQHRISSIAPGTASGVWWGQMPGSSVLYSTKGPDPLVAGLRRLVSENLGDSVDVPAELVGGGHE
ncbi:phage protein NinX family protein [Pseudomonas sp. zfem003]|uniref:phage protein NinX family protein n=1 Tax=Pseudomonas sp. zfem003 TaxID=3078198 RepID=UPI0029287D59|nr:phage protein NinX family protein [Pseudomonas sp. zfem003]MDU9398094.1 phage protein NinX family protein [Pseudomonas sp. zfem003]